VKLIKSEVALCMLVSLLALDCAACKSSTPTPAPPSQSVETAPSQPATQGASPAPSATNASSSVKGTIDACKLLTGEEIQSVQHDTLKETKASGQNSGPFATVQCFYMTNNFVNSISLTVTQKNPASPGGESIRDFWKERFGSAEGREKERERERNRDKGAKRGEEEEEESLPPQPVKALGDEAYWVGNQKVGALYVLNGDKFLRISIGGAHSQNVRTEKMKTLAKLVIKRL
jgi:hypothetical protein